MLTFCTFCSTNDSVLEEMKKQYMLQQVGEGTSNAWIYFNSCNYALAFELWFQIRDRMYLNMATENWSLKFSAVLFAISFYIFLATAGAKFLYSPLFTTPHPLPLPLLRERTPSGIISISVFLLVNPIFNSLGNHVKFFCIISLILMIWGVLNKYLYTMFELS